MLFRSWYSSKLKKTNQDFDEVFNIGDGPHQNKKHVYLNQFDDVLTFDNVWDRHSCKVYSSYIFRK